MRGRGRNADHKRLAAEHDDVIDTVAVDYAFFGGDEQTAKLVLILREHQCRWIEALLFQNTGGQDVWVEKSVADMVRRTGLQRLAFKSDQESAVLDWNNLLAWWVV